MPEKEKLFSKFNVIDYNEKLEEILERKHFSEEAENLLLSVFYKVQGCYKDYKVVKNTSTTEKDFIEKLMNIIDYKCNKITIIKPIIGVETPKYKVNKKSKEIVVFPNEIYLLYALYKLGEYSVKKGEDVTFLSKCMLATLNEGQSTSNSEIIRDFTGWAWEIASNEIENIEQNIFFKNMEFLLGTEFIQNNLSNNEIEKIINDKFIYLYGKEHSKIAIKKMQQFLIAIYSNINSVRKKNVLNQINTIKLKLAELEDKSTFILNLKQVNAKKIKKVKKIDKILSSIQLIRKEFIKKNESLPDNEKIFSISNFVEILEKQRTKSVEIINENNNLLNPLNYARKLNDVKQELKKYEELKLSNTTNADVDKYLIEFQKIFFEGMRNNIKNANTKKELINLIYQFRYYNHIPYKNGVKLKFDKRIEEYWEDVSIELIEKLLDNNIIDVMAEDGKLNYDIVKYILLNKIMKLENINIKMTKYNDRLAVEYYDGNALEDKVEIEVNDLSDIRIKTERKTKLFI